jgi:hypothetical protein
MTSDQQTSAPGTTSFSTPLSQTTDVVATDNIIISATTTEQIPLINPEAVRSNFLALRQLMNDYVVEERTKGVWVQQSIHEPNVIGTTTPLPDNPFSTAPVLATPPATSFANQALWSHPGSLAAKGVAPQTTLPTTAITQPATNGPHRPSAVTRIVPPNPYQMSYYPQNTPFGSYPMPGAPGTMSPWHICPWDPR